MDMFWNIVNDNLLDWTFFVGLIVVLIAAFVIWRWGYSLLMSFKRWPASQRIGLAFVFVVLFFVVANLPYNTETPNYGIWFAIPVTVLSIATYLVFAAIRNRIRTSKHTITETRRRQRRLLLLASIMFWVWSFGWCIFVIAISLDQKPHVGAEILLRSAICSIRLFAFFIEGSVVGTLGSHEVIKGLISSACFAATICTFTLVMSLVLSRLVAYVHIRHLLINERRNHVYLFFGMNEASKLLAKDICSEHGDSNGVVIYVETNLIGEDEEKTDGWGTAMRMLSHRRRTFHDVPDDDRHALAIANCSLWDIDATNNVWDSIGLTTVRQTLEKLKEVRNAELHVFLLSEDRDSNVRSVPVLTKDSLIACPNYKTTIYCHARRDGVNRIVEDLGLANESRTEVRIIDSSHLAIEQLKRQVGNHPVEFVNVNPLGSDNPGTVSSPFVSLLMGFGETGEEALKFLYEYSAFVNEKASSEKSFRSPFCCYVVDKNMRNQEGHFISEIPGALYKKCDEERDSATIKFYPYDYCSDAFYTQVLGKIADTLNYVVIALGDDEQNMTVAVEILRYVRKKRADLNNFRIYVRAYEKGSFTHLKEIAKHYNMRLGKDESDLHETIVLFGQSENLYSYELVVKDLFKEAGRQYYEAYRSLLIDPGNDEGTWEERQKNTMKPKGTTTKWERMNKIRRKESQDLSNALHAQTKIRLLQKAVGEENAQDFALKVLSSREGKRATIHYPLLSSAENKLMLNFAMCEHLRWNAAHEMLGYVNNEDGHVCDERTKQHNCLKLWEELDKESDEVDYVDDYKIFDYGVVETSFKLKYKQEN